MFTGGTVLVPCCPLGKQGRPGILGRHLTLQDRQEDYWALSAVSLQRLPNVLFTVQAPQLKESEALPSTSQTHTRPCRQGRMDIIVLTLAEVWPSQGDAHVHSAARTQVPSRNSPNLSLARIRDGRPAKCAYCISTAPSSRPRAIAPQTAR